MKTLYICEKEDEFVITGSVESLQALGEMLLLKAKHEKTVHVSFYDGTDKPIRIVSDLETIRRATKK